MDIDYYIYNPLTSYSPKLACFDLDDTIIETKSGKKFAVDLDDWKLKTNVLTKINNLLYNKYSILVFTNQKGVNNTAKFNSFIQKIKNINKLFNDNITFYIAFKDDLYRKPFTGLWKLHTSKFNTLINDCFYVGDAWSKEHSFSDSDYNFARNIGINFYIADKYFNDDEPTPYKTTELPITYNYQHEYTESLLDKIKSHKFIIMVGSPATGKTTFCSKYLKDYLHISRDNYDSNKDYTNAIKDALKLDLKIVIDNTNPTDGNRQLTLKSLNNPKDYILLYRDIPKEVAMYLNKYRYFVSEDRSKLLPDVAIHTWYKKFEKTKDLFEIPFYINEKLEKLYF